MLTATTMKKGRAVVPSCRGSVVPITGWFLVLVDLFWFWSICASDPNNHGAQGNRKKRRKVLQQERARLIGWWYAMKSGMSGGSRDRCCNQLHRSQ